MARFTLAVGFLVVLGVLQGGWFVNALPAVSNDNDPADDTDPADNTNPADDLANAPIAKAFSSFSLTKEFFYRLDVVPCTLPEPEANYMYKATAKTFVFYEWFTGALKCFIYEPTSTTLHFNKANELIIKPDVTENGLYKSKALERYHIECPEGIQCKLMMTNVDLQDKVSIGGQKICLDYVLIDDPGKGTKSEYCGNNGLKDYRFRGSLDITFRSGSSEQKSGFEIRITKLNNAMAEECIQEEDAFMEQGEAATPYPLQGDNNRNENDIKKQEKTRYIPSTAKDTLLYFYGWNNNQADKASVESHEGILRLAALSERSCNSLTSAIAEKVLSLFPVEMAAKARAQVFNDNNNYDESNEMEFA